MFSNDGASVPFEQRAEQDDEGLVDDNRKTLSGASVPFEQRAEATWTKRRGGRGAGEAAVG